MNKIEQAIALILSTSLSDNQKQQALLLVCSSEQNQPKPQFKPVKNPPQDTFVYLIENEQGHIKIGFSGNPEKRLSQLKTGCPSAKLLHKFIGTMQDEKHLQSLFSGKNIDKEWFRLNGGDIEEIKEYFEVKKSIKNTQLEQLIQSINTKEFFKKESFVGVNSIKRQCKTGTGKAQVLMTMLIERGVNLSK